MLQGLLPLIVLVVLVVVVFRRWAGRSPGELREPIGVSTRRFVELAGLLAAGGFGAAGLSGLLGAALPEADLETAELARHLAFTAVGVPASAALAVMIRRRLAADPERRSFGWRAYLVVALTASLMVAMAATVRVLEWVFGAEPFRAGAAGAWIVWTLVWAGHWMVASRTSDLGGIEVHTTVGSAIGLGTAAAGAAAFVGAALAWWYDGLFGAGLGPQGAALGEAGAAAVVGGAVWWWYWVARTSRAPRTALWKTEVVVAGVLGGVIAVTVTAGLAATLGLEWWIGDPASEAARHFRAVPFACGAGLVGLLVWRYHRRVLLAGAPPDRVEAARVYDYVVWAVTLATAAVGATAGIVAAIESWIVAEPEREPGAGILSMALALLAVGTFGWIATRVSIHRRMTADPAAEVASPIRRVYLLVLFGIAGVVSLVCLVVVLVAVLNDALEGSAGRATLQGVEVAAGLALSAGLVGIFHGLLHRADRRMLPAPERKAGVREVVLVCGDGRMLAEAIARGTGAKVRVWSAAGRVPAPDEEAMLAVVEGETHEHLVVITDPSGGFEVIPFDEVR